MQLRFLPRNLLRLLLGLALMPAPGRAAEPGANWIRVQAPDVTVLSDASRKDAVEFAVRYAAFRAALAEMLVRPGQRLAPSTILLFRSGREFERRFGTLKSAHYNQVSLTTEVDGAVLIGQVLAGGDRDETLRMAFEFETVTVLRQLGYFVPVWAAQGTGKVFSTLTTRKGITSIGALPSGAADSWIGRPVPWPRFFEVHTASPEYRDIERSHIYHSQAWALLHRIWLAEGDGRERFRQLAAAVRAGPDLAAVESVLGVGADQWSALLGKHIGGRRRLLELPFDEAAMRARLEVGPAVPTEVRVQFSNLLFAAGKNLEAEHELAQVQAAAPASAAVKEALARVAARQRDSDRAVELYREAIALGSRSAHAYLVSASHWLDQASARGVDEAGGGTTVADSALVEIRQALQLSPGLPDAYRLLGRAFYLRPEIGEEHVQELSAGVGPSDVGGRTRFYRALLFSRLRKGDECVADLRHLVGASDTADNVRRQSQEILHDFAFDHVRARVEALVKEGRHDEARQLAETEQATAAGGARRDAYERLLRWVKNAAR